MRDLACEIISGDTRYSGADVARLSSTIASHLSNAGLERGCRIAVIAQRGFHTPVALHGIMRAGMVAVPTNPHLPQRAQTDLLHRFGCAAVIAPTDAPLDLGVGVVYRFEDLLGTISTSSAPESPAQDEVPAVLVTTSGSTGEPKGAVLSFRNLWSSAAGSNRNIPFGPGDRWLLSLPLYHVGGIGILFRAAEGGGAVVIPSDGDSLLASCRRYEVTHLSVVPVQLTRLLDEMATANDTMTHIKAILVGGSAISPHLISRGMEFGLPICTSYGLTEMSSQVTTTSPSDSPDRLLTSGRQLQYREIKVDDHGEICVRGETLFSGYVDGSGLTRPLDVDGWYHTGDIGSLDGSGYLSVFGRKDNMFISGGENIHPEEIEAVIRLCPGVIDALVVPVQSSQWGDRPAAFIQMEGDAEIDVSTLKDVMSEQLPKYKFPEYFLPWPKDQQVGLKPNRSYFAALARDLIRKRL